MQMEMKFTALEIIRSKYMSLMNPVWISITDKGKHCSNCGAEVREKPYAYQYVDSNDDGYKFLYTVIIPDHCEKCGEYFDYIEAPCP